MRDLLPRKPLPDRKRNRDGRVEVAPRSGRARQDGKGDADGERPPDLEDGGESREAEVLLHHLGRGRGECEGGDGGDTGEDIEEDTGGFGEHFADDTRAGVLEVEFALGDGAGVDDVPGEVALEGFGGADLDVAGPEAGEVVVVMIVGGVGRCHDCG